ncbi:MAG: S8 family serine peptidase [Bacteroidota bacterium]
MSKSMQRIGIFLFMNGFALMLYFIGIPSFRPTAAQNAQLVKLSAAAEGLAHYYVFFKDKGPVLGAYADFNARVAKRRSQQNIALIDEYDRLVYQPYIDQVAKRVDSLRIHSRWLNAVSVRANTAQINAVFQLDCVERIQAFHSEAVLTQSPVSKAGEINPRLDTLLSLTHGLMGLDTLTALALNAKGVRIAILDAGFKGANQHPALQKLMQANRVVGTYDFYKDRQNVYANSSHGLQVLSCMAGYYEDRPMGAATEAEYLLARIVKQFFALGNDEDLWIAAAEWAEANGAEIINSSITYVENYLTPGEMDGLSSPVTQAAQIAAQKGVLVVCAMGNEGDKPWRIMGAPADALEVLSVGGTYPMVPLHLPMASKGPNSRRKLKPNLAAPAFVLAAMHKNLYGESVGTSFSTPLVAGIAGVLRQQYPQLKPAELISRLEKSGHFYPYYDYDLGYGVPSMSRLLSDSIPVADSLFQIRLVEDTVWLEFDTLYMQRDTQNFPYGHMLYYHLERPEQYLKSYQAYRLPNNTASHYFIRQKPVFGKLRIWMDDYLYERRFNGD